jgi:hypothetical protein
MAAAMGTALLVAMAPTALDAKEGPRPQTPPKVSTLKAPNANYVSPRKAEAKGTLRRTSRNPRCRWGGHPCR